MHFAECYPQTWPKSASRTPSQLCSIKRIVISFRQEASGSTASQCTHLHSNVMALLQLLDGMCLGDFLDSSLQALPDLCVGLAAQGLLKGPEGHCHAGWQLDVVRQLASEACRIASIVSHAPVAVAILLSGGVGNYSRSS